MKPIKFVIVLINMLLGLMIAGPLGAAAGIGLSFIPQSDGIKAGLYPEVWTGEMVKAFRHDDAATFLQRIPDFSQYAEHDVIHLVDVGADPEVLINNTTYPIAIQDLPDADIAISLDKFQTKATRVTDDELFAINYDKMGSVIERHKSTITETKHDKAIHALAPQSHTADTPVVITTGDKQPDGRRALVRKDLIKLKAAFDKKKVPKAGRILVLCEDHVNDLLEKDQKFKDQYYNYTSGKIANMYGFEVYSYVGNPHFSGAEYTKKGFGAAVVENMDYQASVAFYAPRMFKASGSTKTYMSAAKDNPTTQENLINFRHYFIALPKKQEAIGAIVSTLLDIKSVASISDITVANGTEFGDISLPETVTVTLEDDSTVDLAIDWDADTTPTYNKTSAGDYILKGSLVLSGARNPEALEAEVKITVES